MVVVGGVALAKGQQKPRWDETPGTNLRCSVWKDKCCDICRGGGGGPSP